MTTAAAETRAALRVVLTVVATLVVLYLIYLLRRPIGWIAIAAFVAVAAAGPVSVLNRRMPRAAAIAVVYAAALAVPMLLGVLILPSVVEQAAALASDAPRHAADLQEALRSNDIFQRVDEQFDIGAHLRELADDAPNHIGDAAAVLSSVGLGVLDSLATIAIVLVLSALLVASAPRWVAGALDRVPAEHRERAERALARVASAVAGYVRAQVAIALIAAVSGYVVMTVLGVPFREPLAVVIACGSLIPVVGSLLWGVTIGLVTLTVGFPTTTILWAVWAVVYPQIENYVLQPQLQRRAVHVEPFVIIVAVLFGATLLGIVGALFAIPVAAAIQILLGEWWEWRREVQAAEARP